MKKNMMLKNEGKQKRKTRQEYAWEKNRSPGVVEWMKRLYSMSNR